MRISYNWLKEFVKLDLSPDELAERLTLTGTEIEKVEHIFPQFKGVVTARITSIEKRNKLTICQVDGGGASVTVVCGAPNVQSGQIVPLALPGALLPGGRKIGIKTFDEVESQGMICSEKELGLSDYGEGIMVLEEEHPLGIPLEEALCLNDYILDADLTPNRPDCMSLLGVAREVAAILHLPLNLPPLPSPPQTKGEIPRVEVEDGKGCPRYTARIIGGVKISPSPFWLRRKLESAGLRAVNNVVDITNFVMIERGQPLHSFDWDKIRDQRIIVRRSLPGESLVTLDNQERRLEEGTLLICDGKGPVAIAGIMGGMDTEVGEGTKNLLLESAYFDPHLVRRGAKSLGLASESSQRFERGVDPFGLLPAQERATELFCRLAGAKAVGPIADISPSPPSSPRIRLREKKVSQVLGVTLNQKRLTDLLSPLGFAPKGKGIFAVPGYRPDVTREIDLIEEVARIYGYDKIPSDNQARGALPARITERERRLRKVREILSGLGLREVITNSLVDPRWIEAIGYKGELVRLLNPLSQELSCLRPTLLPSLLWVAGLNLRRGIREVRIYEVGKVFSPEEGTRLSGLILGDQSPPYWGEREKGINFYSLKGIVETFLGLLRLGRGRFIPQNDPPYEEGRTALLMLGKKEIGILGKLSSQVSSRFDLEEEVFCFELDMDSVLELVPTGFKFVPPSRFPPAKRDLAILVDQEIPAGEISEAILKLGSPLVKDVSLFDLYQGKQIPPGEKSLAFSLWFSSPHSTLTDQEVERVQERILQGLQDKFGARIRC